jgi:hypothetical protein
VWYLLFARDPRSGLLFVLGPLLAPLGALGLAPALLAEVRGLVRRAALAGAAVLSAAAVAELVATESALSLNATASPGKAVEAVAAFLSAHSALGIEALVFAAAAATTALARSRGLWGVGLWGAAFFAVALIAPAGAFGAFPLALAVFGGTVLLAVPRLRNSH